MWIEVRIVGGNMLINMDYVAMMEPHDNGSSTAIRIIHHDRDITVLADMPYDKVKKMILEKGA